MTATPGPRARAERCVLIRCAAMRTLHLFAVLALGFGCTQTPSRPPATPAAASTASAAPSSTVPSTSASAAAETAPTAPATAVAPRTARLVRLARVWGEVRYLHPQVVAGAVDWDKALVDALPAALAAQTDEDEIAALRALVEPLHDASTRIERTPPEVAASPSQVETRTVEGVLVARAGVRDWAALHPTAARLKREMSTATAMVLDLRARPGEPNLGTMLAEALADALPAHDCVGVSVRSVEHHGYRPQVGLTSGGYATTWATPLATAYPAAKTKAPSRAVFVVNTASDVPDVAWAMQSVGDATILAQGKLRSDEHAATDVVPLVDGYRALLRRAEPVGAPPRPDLELDEALPDAKVIEIAVREAKTKPSTRTRPRDGRVTTTATTWRPDLTYASTPYPSRELRVLALFRFYNVVRYFYPYLHLMGDAWDDALAELLPRFENAADAGAYAESVAELAARIPDGHVSFTGPAFDPALLGWPPSILVQLLDGKPIVTAVADDAPTRASGIAVGDEIVAVEGEAMEARMKRLRPRVPGANESWRAFRVAERALAGDPKQPVKLVVRGADERARELAVPRSRAEVHRGGPVWKMLDDRLGYVDLDRLERADVDAAFAALARAQALVLDMRGYPHGTAWAIAPRLNTRHAKYAAQFFEPLVSGREPSLASTMFFQDIPTTSAPLYSGKTVMLVDERTMSQSEHTGLFFEAANGTRFIGSQTSGSNGDVTTLSLPGGIVVHFTGHDVRHADGRQLQRVGLVPDVLVRPTRKGVREGRDEVLERAIADLRDRARAP
jgi:C-terminal processing protease CtpA/Prc